MAESSDDGYEIEKPPERRAPSSRASKGSRMGKLIAEEEEEEGDNQNEISADTREAETVTIQEEETMEVVLDL